jgi:hypothetical protein
MPHKMPCESKIIAFRWNIPVTSALQLCSNKSIDWGIIQLQSNHFVNFIHSFHTSSQCKKRWTITLTGVYQIPVEKKLPSADSILKQHLNELNLPCESASHTLVSFLFKINWTPLNICTWFWKLIRWIDGGHSWIFISKKQRRFSGNRVSKIGKGTVTTAQQQEVSS